MGCRYQLSKIGKQKRKSGLCRLFHASIGPRRWRLSESEETNAEASDESTRLQNKLPQVGQEPVETVESRRTRPDGDQNTR
jgi:hypothetical protein